MQIEKYTDPKKALISGAKRYFGAVCEKHPEIGGERNARSRACISCSREKMRNRRAEDPDYYRRVTRIAYDKWYPKNKHKVRAYQRLRNTGIDDGTYKRLLAIQDNRCALCFAPFDKAKPHADHCHDSKKPRGVLCSICNQAEGMIRKLGLDPAEFGKRLSEYLANPPAKKLEN